MEKIRFTDWHGTFTVARPENTSYLYFPIAGERGLKGCVTPNLGGDSMLDQETFLLEPVSVSNLHNNRSTRNFWVYVENEGAWSATGNSASQENVKFTRDQDESQVTAGLMWHTARRVSQRHRIKAEITSFIPFEENVELMQVRLENLSDHAKRIAPIAAIPIYGRSADNLRDHRNVTSMLHRIRTTEHGVEVKPTMSFDEKGHRENKKIYYVMGFTGDGFSPVAFFPTVDSLIGEGGSFTHPRVIFRQEPGVPAGTEIMGREAMGGLKFPEIPFGAGQTVTYTILIGVTEDEKEIERIAEAYRTEHQVQEALEHTKNYWKRKVNVRFSTGREGLDAFLAWVSFQPFLRRLYGCSFLPYHDYGRGGRGWRDLWQDCLSLLFMEPDDVREMIVSNFGGVRMDGTNATIIGEGLGNFIADRNGIARVWMDHAFWPFKTLRLYIDQTGDYQILEELAPYFKDAQVCRGEAVDGTWSVSVGSQQMTRNKEVYRGTLIEHLLIENLCAFYEVGEHNIIKLRGADWNDALDMASEHGESVAFTFAYAGNLSDIADMLEQYEKRCSVHEIHVLEEILPLLEAGEELYGSPDKKKGLLCEYGLLCQKKVSGNKKQIPIEGVVKSLRSKAKWMKNHLRKQEWISGASGEGWFNSYYDDHKNQVERFSVREEEVRMILTGQVFAVMSGTAEPEDISKITKAADHYLYREEIGGYRLNTDFRELKFDMGRMFGFAYGEKENGAVFSHMAVMYANALYSRGFAREGHKVLKALADTALNFEVSRMYPGIPEYFNAEGRGVYPYLTGAASWYMMTMITEVFGVRGESGDLTIMPRLMAEEFGPAGKAGIYFIFAGKEFMVEIENSERKEFGSYRIQKALMGEQEIPIGADGVVRIPRERIDALRNSVNQIHVFVS